jgi:hypothetical protein
VALVLVHVSEAGDEYWVVSAERDSRVLYILLKKSFPKVMIFLPSGVNTCLHLSLVRLQQLRVLQEQILAVFFRQIVLNFLLMSVLYTNQH